MKTTPKSMRLQIGIFGRTNVGKSSFLNLVAGQDVAITSPVAGTTTDVVEKVMELLPIGPVCFLDTAGLDDTSVLAQARLQKTRKIFDRADVILLVCEPGCWGGYEDGVVAEAKSRSTPLIIVVNKTDLQPPTDDFSALLKSKSERCIFASSLDWKGRDTAVNALKRHLIEVCPDDFLKPPPLIGDLVRPCGIAALIIPIDKEAPKGRLILPQGQTIRDALDHGAATLVVREHEYAEVLRLLGSPPDIVVCDSQVVTKMVADTPSNVPCTTFSILFARYKGDLVEMTKGAAVIDGLVSGDKVLIAEACSHHAIEDDIGRVKIPRWLRQRVRSEVHFDVCSGRDYPENLSDYKLVIHCGGCMLTRREMLFRIERARAAGVAITNYGIAIAVLQGIAERVLAPFPAALEALKSEQTRCSVLPVGIK